MSTDDRPARGRPPQVPATPRTPLGLERLAGTRRAPARRKPPEASDAPVRPELPSDVEPDLPVKVRKEIDRQVSPKARASDLKLSLHLAAIALEQEDTESALLYARWAKHLAPRLPLVREALGIAAYHAANYHEAVAELQAYRRLSGRTDQNHLIADSMRDAGEDLERAVDLGLELCDDASVEWDRRIEAAIVVAAIHGDMGAPRRGRVLLRRFLAESTGSGKPSIEARIRLLWMAADLAALEGDTPEAVGHLDELLSLDPTYPDAAQRRMGLNPDV